MYRFSCCWALFDDKITHNRKTKKKFEKKNEKRNITEIVTDKNKKKQKTLMCDCVTVYKAQEKMLKTQNRWTCNAENFLLKDCLPGAAFYGTVFTSY